ncbi:MAG: RNA polymerase sigma factor [Planctomycetota bacterium]
MTTPISLDELQSQAPFLRRLARALVGDGADADDLVQETWVAALEHHPRPADTVRGWLERLARNRARSQRRGAARRTRREGIAAAARSAAARPPGSPGAGAEVAERVLAAVLALDEPYRSTVLERYYQDLAPTEIAAQNGVPVDTVHTRLRRARRELRQRLDRDFGTREAWGGALLLAAGIERPARWGAVPSVALAAGLAALLGGGSLLARQC